MAPPGSLTLDATPNKYFRRRRRYAKDVMAYIPSLRVLKEGRYEGDTSIIPYGMPAKWGPVIEKKIIAKVHELVEEVRRDNASHK